MYKLGGKGRGGGGGGGTTALRGVLFCIAKSITCEI